MLKAAHSYGEKWRNKYFEAVAKLASLETNIASIRECVEDMKKKKYVAYFALKEIAKRLEGEK